MPADLLVLLRFRAGVPIADASRDADLLFAFRGARGWLEKYLDRPVVDDELDGPLLAGALCVFDMLWTTLHRPRHAAAIRSISSDGQRIEYFEPILINGLPTMAFAMLDCYRRMSC